MKRFLILTLLLLSALSLSAQSLTLADVYLRDGRIIRGHVSERTTRGMVKVTTEEGKTHVFLPAQVLNVVHVRSLMPLAHSPFRDFYVEGGYTTPNQYDVQVTAGLRLSNYLFVGVGAGLILQPDAMCHAIPVYADGRFLVPLGLNFKPYADLRLGYGFAPGGGDTSGGAFVGLTFGVEVNNYVFGLGYQCQTQHTDMGAYDVTTTEDGLSLRFGYRF